MGSLRSRLERLETRRTDFGKTLTTEALRHLSDEDLDALEDALEAGQVSGDATFEELYAASSERSRRALETWLETMAAIKEGRDPPVEKTASGEGRNGYRIWKYYKNRAKGSTAMSRKSLKERAREEAARIKAQEAAEEERRQKKMGELRRDADKRREAEAAEERKRKARQDKQQDERKRAESERLKASVFRSWTANGGTAGEFEAAWPEIKADMLKRRTIEQDARAREEMRTGSHSRI